MWLIFINSKQNDDKNSAEIDKGIKYLRSFVAVDKQEEPSEM